MTFIDVSGLFDQEAYSDITIKFSGREVKAHKLVLCSSSEYFKALCGPESKFMESKESTIELFDDDPDALAKVLQYIYNFSYQSQNDDWRSHLEVYKVAKKYLLAKLADEAGREVKRIIQNSENPDEILELIKIAPLLAIEKDPVKRFCLLDNNLGMLLSKAEFRTIMEQNEELMGAVLGCLDAIPRRCKNSNCRNLDCWGSKGTGGVTTSCKVSCVKCLEEMENCRCAMKKKRTSFADLLNSRFP